MYSIKVFTFLALLVTGAIAVPAPTQSVNQTNVCGNGLQQYCCNDSNSCSPTDQSSTCSATVICCNANDSIQTCIGSVNVDVPASQPPPITKPTPTPIQLVNQTNVCGNGLQQHCCNGNQGSASCSPMDQSATCSATVVCCNANDSIQVCIGSIDVDITTNVNIDIITGPGDTSSLLTPPSKPTPAPVPSVNQSNFCGNGLSQHCCDSGSCSPMDKSDVCSATVVCCNANSSIQTCIGSITI